MFEGLAGAIDGLDDVDLVALSDAELSAAMVEGRRQQARLDAQMTELTAAWEARALWDGDDVRTPAAWISDGCRLPVAEARQQVRHARMLRHLSVTRRAHGDGEISVAHVRVLLGAVNHRTAARYADDEKVLVDAARTLAFDDFVRTVRYWSQHADPDGCEQSAERQAERRGVHLSASIDGMGFGTFTLPPIENSIVAGELARLERELFDADWADARARLGDLVSVDALCRTPAQRRPAPLFEVLVGYETLAGRVCELADGTVIEPCRVGPVGSHVGPVAGRVARGCDAA